MRHALVRFLLPVFVIVQPTAGQAGEDPGGEVPLITSQLESGEMPGWKSFHEDAKARTGDVWKLTDDGLLICKGTPRGYLYSEQDYLNFVLKLQWRWPPGKPPGNGGVLLRMQGNHKIWPRSLEAQLNSGDAGDFWGLDGYPLDGPAERKKTVEHDQFGTLTNLKKLHDLERPAGQWNQLEVVAADDTVTVLVNGQVVNRATKAGDSAMKTIDGKSAEPTPGRYAVAPGRICLTAEGDEIHFRNVRLRRIKRPGRAETGFPEVQPKPIKNLAK